MVMGTWGGHIDWNKTDVFNTVGNPEIMRSF